MSRPDARLVMRLREATGCSVLLCQKMLKQVPDEHQERYVVFHEQERPISLQDPIEADPTYAEILAEVNAKAKAFVDSTQPNKNEPGLIHYFWSIKKRFLRETYGIDWKSPQELRPSMCID